jgi:5-methylcytosine-specific restriction endonuclease McrA
MSKNITYEFVKENFENEDYVLLSKEYKNAHTKLEYICSNGHKHSISWRSWQQGHRCFYCNGKPIITIEEVKKSFESKDYVLLSEEYKNSNTKLDYICSKGHKHSITWSAWNQGERCLICYITRISGAGNVNWKGGLKDSVLFDTYYEQLNFAEEVRPFCDEENRKFLEVRCSKCSKWFLPKREAVKRRIKALNGKKSGESRFYCSQECKDSCNVFNKRSDYYMDLHTNVHFYNKNELSIWSQEVLKRADYKCEICGESSEHAHHIQPKKLEPGLALDPDNGLAVCKKCHYEKGHNDKMCTIEKLKHYRCV